MSMSSQVPIGFGMGAQNEAQMIEQAMMQSKFEAEAFGLGNQDDKDLQDALALSEVIHASQNDGQPGNPNVDNMTYEQILELEEENGKVSKGLDKAIINSIPTFMWRQGDTSEDSCSICMMEFEPRQRCNRLRGCNHEFHSECIKKWLSKEKKCPMCMGQI